METNINDLNSLIQALPCQYQNIYGHKEYDCSVRGIETPKNGESLKNIIKQYQQITGKKNLKILDVGCAQGYYAFCAAEMGCEVDGVDLDKNNIAVCKCLNAEFNLGVKFEECMFDLNFVKKIKDEQYDIIFLFNVIHHVACRCSYNYKTNGLSYAKKVMQTLSKKCKILIGSLAVAGENIAWNKFLPANYRKWLTDFKFYDELNYQFISGNYQRIYRPVFFASNNFSIENNILIQGSKCSLMSEYLYFVAPRKSMILKKELLTKYPDLVTGHLKNFNFKSQFKERQLQELDFEFEKYNLMQNNKIYKYNKKYFKKGVLGLVYSLKAGRIVKTIYKEKNSECRIIKKIIGTKASCKNCHYELTLIDNNRKYLKNAKLELDILLSLKDNEKAFLTEFDIYFTEIFRQMRYKNNLLKPETYDAVPINCLRTIDKKFYFYDFEFEIVEGIEKEFIIFKNLVNILHFINRIKDLEKYYYYFTKKYNLEKSLDWCKFYEETYAHFVSEMYKGESWNEYNNSCFVKLITNFTKLLTLLIPIKSIRGGARKKLVKYFAFRNYRIAKKVGLR